MKIFTGVRSIFSVFILAGLVVGLQGCSGESLKAPVIANATAQSYAKATAKTLSFTNSGGGSLSSCSVTPALPEGLSIGVSSNAGTCEITGAANVPQTSSSYTVTATNAAGSDTATIAITITSTVTGYYDTGNISVTGTGNLQGLVHGNRLMFYSASSNLLYDATMTITGTDYTANFTIYTSGLSPVTATATGSFIAGSSITGVITGGGIAVDGTFTLSYAGTNNELSVLSKINQSWGLLLNTALDGLTFDATGQITAFTDWPTNGTYLANCTVSSASAIQPIASTRLYSVNFTLTGCANATTTVDGTYTGLATTFVNTNPDDRLLIFVTNTTNLVSIYDSAEY